MTLPLGAMGTQARAAHLANPAHLVQSLTLLVLQHLANQLSLPPTRHRLDNHHRQRLHLDNRRSLQRRRSDSHHSLRHLRLVSLVR